MKSNEERWIGIGGLAFVALAIVLIAVVPMAPNVHANSAKLLSHYKKSKQAPYFVGGFVTMAAVVEGAFWFWYFRELLSGLAPARRLATVAFAGAVIFAAGGGVGAGLDFLLSDAAGHASASTLEVLNYLQADLNLGLVAAGVVIFLLATGLVVIRFGVLPVWLGWLAVALAVVSFAITPFSLMCIGVWMIPTNIILITRSRSEALAVSTA